MRYYRTCNTNISVRSRLTKLPQPQHTLGGFSPIAADGGFGPMGSDSEGEAETDAGESQFGEDSENKDGMDDFGDDFDDFEAGVDNDEFGEFDDMPEKPSMTKTASPELEHQLRSAQPIPLPDIPFVSACILKMTFSFCLCFEIC